MAALIEVIDGGLQATVQDLGRPAAARFAVPPGGAMDVFALEAANRLVGNWPGAAGIEITGGRACFRMLRTTALAITGADFAPVLNRASAPMWMAFVAPAGSQLGFAGRQAGWGARAYLAVMGGIEVRLVLGSASTYIPGGFGGYAGRALQTGDVLAGGTPRSPDLVAGNGWLRESRPAYGNPPVLRVIPGRHAASIEPLSPGGLCGQYFEIGMQSNRMGYRLEGAALKLAHLPNLPSMGVVAGAIQVPPDGKPILLMADAQTTGGYPIAGVVIRADLPLAAQLLPGDRLSFKPTTEDEAIEAWREQRRQLDGGLIRDDDGDAGAAISWAGALD